VNATIPIRNILKETVCEVTLTGVKSWKTRLAIGVIFFKIGAWIIGMKGEVKMGDYPIGKMERKIKACWSCSDFAHHEHRWKWSAWVCGRIQYFMRLFTG